MEYVLRDMATRIGVNGFGRMGRLALRAGWGDGALEFAHVNGLAGDAHTAAHLVTFDSVHGRWDREVRGDEHGLTVDGTPVGYSAHGTPGAVPWDELGIDVVLECSGRFRTPERLAGYFERGVRKVVVAAPVKDDRALNVVVGVNDDRYDPGRYDIVTAASCTTNCLAPVVKVIQEELGIARGSIKLDGLAVRVPLLNASLTDCVFEVATRTSVQEVNDLLRTAADGELEGILGYEERPLVSIDYRDDPRSAIVDAPSTMVTDGTQVKILAWYDNEWGYANRLVELAHLVAAG